MKLDEVVDDSALALRCMMLLLLLPPLLLPLLLNVLTGVDLLSSSMSSSLMRAKSSNSKPSMRSRPIFFLLTIVAFGVVLVVVVVDALSVDESILFDMFSMVSRSVSALLFKRLLFVRLELRLSGCFSNKFCRLLKSRFGL